jgi:NDP-mannose synthase
MHAVILAGGKGTRLKPYTTVLPKPLMPIGDMPILEVVLRQLKAAGFLNVTMAVGYLAELLKAFFGNGEKFGLNINYSFEEKPLGTIGPLKLIDNLPETFLTMNGDILTDLKFNDLINFHRKKQAALTIATYKRQVKVDYGVLEVSHSGFLNNYIEKPNLDYLVSMGIYIIQKEVLKYVPKGEYFDLPQLVQKLIQEGEPVASYPFDGYWLDIGRHDDYAVAIEEFEQRRMELLPGE